MFDFLFSKNWSTLRNLIWLKATALKPSGDASSNKVGTGQVGYMTI